MENRFYSLKAGWGNQFYFGHYTSGRLHYYDHYMRGYENRVSLNIIKGGRPGDFLRNDMGLLVCSQRVIDLLEEHRFTGWGTYRVEVTGGKGDLPQYCGLVVYGKGGHILPEESGAIFSNEIRPDGSRKVMGIQRLVIEENQWDGSDFFYLEEFPGGCYVTERVLHAFKKAKITNSEFTPFEEFNFGV